MTLPQTDLDDAILDLIVTYHDLNPLGVDELTEEPSPLGFMRYVARNRPFVVRGAANEWKARRRWNAEYLTGVMRSQPVNVAITPHGNADSVVEDSQRSLHFVKPYDTTEPFDSVLRDIQAQEADTLPSGPIKYAQTQNDNLRNEYSPLFADVPASIPFARIALQHAPEAINFWLGNSHSVTALHKDNYENIYVQVLGRKHFVLLPPVEAACVNERMLPSATYAHVVIPKGDGEEEEQLEMRPDDPAQEVPFATWDPDEPEKRPTQFSRLSRPARVTLEEGDMLYLPALWYHKVSQSCSHEGLCCAVNYWYDMDFAGSFYTLCSFARNAGLLATGTAPKDLGGARGHLDV
ncbi:cupin-like domain-containing protein [Cryomyces antarcticus]